MVYELSLSPNYISSWGLKEAVRELLQNAIDAEKDGHEMFIYYYPDDQRLAIGSNGSELTASQLVLGNSSKSDCDETIGKYGEGFKLAILVLLRDGYEPKIFNNGLKWTPEFIDSHKYNTRVLAIEEEDANQDDDALVFYINNVSQDEYDNLLEYFPCIDKNWGETVECDTGYILKDKRFAGKMFVEGLYIQSDDNFRYGYNFNSDVVDLDRDRRAINYWELRKLTAKSLITGETCDAELVNAIGNSCTDIKDLEDVLDDASEAFLDQYRTIFYATKGLKTDTLVATKSVVNQLKQLDNDVDVVEGTEIQSYLIAKANDKLDLLYEAQEAVDSKSDIETAFDYLIDSAYRVVKEFAHKARKSGFVDTEECSIDKLEEDIEEYTPSYYSNIKGYILEDPEFDWSVEAIEDLKNEVLDKITNEG